MSELENGIMELDDDQLDAVNGGAAIGDVVQIHSLKVAYCPKCGKLLQDYEATITGLRGVLEGKNVYWIKLSCCGNRSSVIETSIIG